ncbi:MAG: branched-chain amino acid ABC transporter permease [Thaumarchaeota archaeon]|jgi:branched-chain amino acid transport system permease protein|nr:branched-chain amino acid ABC transporter permease [Nitrososphaerota archaeon]MCL7393903.1 branched-chain amino acid ABC transporter permease [Candidatus Wolframiiraptor allenii]
MIELSTISIFLTNLIILIGIFIIISLSLNLEYGYAGIPNFGKLLAVAGGAYFVGAVSGRVLALAYGQPAGLGYIEKNLEVIGFLNNALSSSPLQSIGFLVLSIIGAAFFGGLLGYVASYPAIRLRGDYLAITLLAMGEIIWVIADNWQPLIGGSMGVRIPDPFRWIGSQYRPLAVLLTVLITAAIIFLYLQYLGRSPLGRVLKAMRENELSASVHGKDVVKLRTKTLIVGFAIAAISGALNSLWTVSVSPKDFERVRHTFMPWVMVIIGGAGNNIGAVIGAIIFVTLRELIVFYKYSFEAIVPFDVVWLEYLLMGIALVIVLMYRPEGLLPEKPTRTLSERRIREIAARAAPEKPQQD